MCDPKHTAGVDHVVQILRVCGFSVVQYDKERSLGTDFLIFVRDHQHFDLGGFIKIQVGNWPSLMKNPSTDNGRVGWWVRDFTYHDDPFPRLLVLFDENSEEAYWVHVTKDKVLGTGQEQKIFVPRENVINNESVGSLVEVAFGKLPQPAELPGVSDADRLRYALIAPQLIVPHPHLPLRTFSSAEAIALLSLAQMLMLKGAMEYKITGALRSLHDDPSWRLYSALFKWIDKRQAASILSFPSANVEANIAAAAEVIKATVLFEEHLPQRACEILKDALAAREDYNSVDLAWLQVHLARNLIEIGEFDEAWDLALEASLIGRRQYQDPTARYVAGVAMEFVFQLNDLTGRQEAENLFRTIMKYSPDSSSWLRTQILAGGLTDFIEKNYPQWRDAEIILGKEYDNTILKAHSTSLMTGFAADANAWRHAAAAFACYCLLSAASTDELVYALNILRVAGAQDELELATSQFLHSGPAEPLARIMNELSLEDATKSSLPCDFALVGNCVALLDTRTVDNHALWLLNELKNPSKTYVFGISRWYENEIIQVLAKIYGACSSEVMAKIQDYLITIPGIQDLRLAASYAKLIKSIIADDLNQGKEWDSEKLQKLVARGNIDNKLLKGTIEQLRAVHDTNYDRLFGKIRIGDLNALASWQDIDNLPDGIVQRAVLHLANLVDHIIATAASGTLPGSYSRSYSHLSILVHLNISHPHCANWRPCLRMFNNHVSSIDLVPGIETMIDEYQKIPADVARDMREPLMGLMGKSDTLKIIYPDRDADVRGPASALLGLLFPEDVPMTKVAQMLRGDASLVKAAVKILAQRKEKLSLSLFARLSKHDSFEVREAVVSALVTWVLEDVRAEESFSLLTEIVADASVCLISIILSLVSQHSRSDAAEKLLGLVAEKDYAVVPRQLEIIKTKWERQ
ncbi:DUF4365 domain-containing protein [uncultured Corynebacterium sp.]|uniref:DUF4365 domain-containing protein n=1 Tax=uncultured Corynebacterium sp. TaxID=159447 RepID=UPI0028E5B373|nr:DUF4365 domain-containing protein [uncultured Corynebacterium sp.]